ncbi:MAG: hypothetical protein ABJO67_03015 [Pseudoruegeria sp.]
MVKTGYFFVLDGQRFEAQAILLATSLRMQMGDDFPIIAYVPEASFDKITRITRRMMTTLKIEIRAFSTEAGTWAEPYPHGNKILASTQPRDWDVSVFLDSDTVCLNPMDFSDCAEEQCLGVVPEGVPTWGRHDEDWVLPYSLFDLPLPTERVNMERGRRISTLPYFNGGMVAFKEAADENGQRLPDLWLDTALTLDHSPDLPNKRPWLDQIALPIAMARLGGKMIIKPGGYNYSLYRRDANADHPTINLAHYHMPAVFRKWAACRAVSDEAQERCPAKLRIHLRKRFGTYLKRDWQEAAE